MSLFGPVAPAGPCGPVSPRGPESPFGPCGPSGPPLCQHYIQNSFVPGRTVLLRVESRHQPANARRELRHKDDAVIRNDSLKPLADQSGHIDDYPLLPVNEPNRDADYFRSALGRRIVACQRVLAPWGSCWQNIEQAGCLYVSQIDAKGCLFDWRAG